MSRFASSHLILASLIRYAGQFALITVVARQLSPTDVGAYALSIALTAPVFLFAGFGLRTLVLTHDAVVAVRVYVGVRFSLILMATLICSLVAALWMPGSATVVLLVSVAKAGDLLVDLASGYLQVWRRTSRIVLLSCAVTGVGVVGAVIGSLLSAGLIGLLLVSSTGSALCAGILVWLLMRRPDSKRPHSEPRAHGIAKILRAGLPLGANAAVASLLQSIPQYFLAANGGEASVGRFAVLLYITFAAEILLNGQAQAWIPVARKCRSEGQFGLRQVLRKAARNAFLASGVSVAALVVAWMIYPRFLGEFYMVTWPVVAVVMVLSLTQTVLFFLGTALSVMNRYWTGLVATFISLVVVVTISMTLTPDLGVTGALVAYSAAVGIKAVVLAIGFSRRAVVPHQGDSVLIRTGAVGT